MADGQLSETRTLRQAFGAFLTGVTVVTTRDGDGRAIGMTANSFTSVSLDPPLVLVCVGSGSSSFATFAEADFFAVNILREGQHEVAAQFARRGVDRFADIRHEPRATGAPVLQESLAWFDCTLHQRGVAGDHIILIGEVQAFAAADGPPLGYSRGRYVQARDAHAAPLATETTVTAFLVEDDGRILLRQSPDGAWTLPTAHRPRVNAAGTVDEALGLTLRPDATFIYSIYESEEDGSGFLVYRAAIAESGSRAAVPDAPLRWFDVDALPWDAIRSTSLRALLRRYARERQEGTFSIYVDAEGGGQVSVMQGSPRPWSSLNID